MRGERAAPEFHAALRTWLQARRDWRHWVDAQPPLVVATT
jgi:hypothetical protein